MVPTLGQGATQAVECGVVAAKILRAGGTVRDIAAARDARGRFIRDVSLEASETLPPGMDVVAGTRRKTAPAFLEKLRRTHTEVA
jgi:salicylate hydroxylase